MSLLPSFDEEMTTKLPSSDAAVVDMKCLVDKVWLETFRRHYQKDDGCNDIFVVVRNFCAHFNLDDHTSTLMGRKQTDVRNLGAVANCSPKLAALADPALEEHVLAIYSYTLDTLFKHANSSMNDQENRIFEIGSSGEETLSSDVLAVLPWMKKVSVALEKLPNCFNYCGTVYRVMSFRFAPCDFAERFKVGNTLVWHSLRSTSSSKDILSNRCFTGTSGTVYEIRNAGGKEICLLSQYENEAEILLPMGATMQVKEARIGSEQGVDFQDCADWVVFEMLPAMLFLS